MKKILKALGIFLLVIIIIIAGLFRLLIGEVQKPPQITTGEFPFVVEYEINGETYIIEDTVVCEFDGYDSSSLTFNKPRMWKEYLKGGDEEKSVIFKEENNNSVLKPKRLNEKSRVVLNYGRAEYYMGDPNQKGMIYAKPFFYYSEQYATDEKTTHITGTELSEAELQKYFDIKVKRFEFSEPIKNKFK